MKIIFLSAFLQTTVLLDKNYRSLMTQWLNKKLSFSQVSGPAVLLLTISLRAAVCVFNVVFIVEYF